MQRRQDLWQELTTEVRLADMVNKTPDARAGKPEALRIAKEVLRENDDVIDNELPSPLIAQPKDLHAFQLGQMKAADLAKSHTYPVVRGGAWCTKRGRVILVEFKDTVNEALSPITVNEPAPANPNATATQQLGQPMAPPAKRGHPNSYGPSDEGSHATITVLAKHPKVYQMDWMPDEATQNMGAHAGFHVFGEDEGTQWRPMNLQLYLKLAELVKKQRSGQVAVVNKLNQPQSNYPVQRPVPKPKAPMPAPAKPGEEPQMRDDLGVAPRKKFLGMF